MKKDERDPKDVRATRAEGASVLNGRPAWKPGDHQDVVLLFGAVLDFGGDRGFCQFGQLPVGLFLFVEGLLEQLGDFLVAEMKGEGARGAVAGDFVVLDALRGADQPGIADGVRGIFADEFTAFLDEAFHGFAFVAGEFLAEEIGNLIEPFNMAFGLLEVFLKAGFEFLVGGGFRHFRERLYQLVLGAEQVFEFVQEEVFERFEFHTKIASNGGRMADGCGAGAGRNGKKSLF